MTDSKSRQPLTLLLVFGAVVFGMVLAGSLDLTAPGAGSPEPLPAADQGTAAATYNVGLPDFADLVERVSPAVVSVEARSFQSSPRGRGVDPFEFFFGPRGRGDQEPEGEEEFRSESGGSGFVISEDGLIVTNNHVVRGADEILIHLGDEVLEAEVRGTDPATDLALLEAKSTNGKLTALPLGDSEHLRVGEWVIAVGSPLGLEDTVTVGVVSAKNRRINISPETQSFENFIQTDAAINFGNSGGPLIDLQGRVVGINTAINFGSENIGFAVPVDILKEILPQLREEGRVSRGYLGIGVNDLDQAAAEAYGLESTDGALVSSVQSGFPADEAGLMPGDVILSVDGRGISDTRDLIDYVSAQGPDATVTLEVLRDDERIDIDVELTERPTDDTGAAEPEEDAEGGIEWLGLRYQDLTPNQRATHRIPEEVQGVWITEISPRSQLYDDLGRAGRAINIITEVNGEAVDDVESFEAAVAEAEPGSRLRMYVRRFAGGQEVAPVFVFPQVPE